MLWNAKKKLYNFHVLSIERYWINESQNRAWICCTCTTDVLECSFASNSNTCCSLFLEATKSGAQKFQLKNTTFLVILGLCLFLIFSLISQIWILLFRPFLGDFVGLRKGELTCKRGEEKSDWTHMPLFSLCSNFSFLFLSWPCLAKLLYLGKGNWSFGINKIVRSNLFLLFNLCSEVLLYLFSWLSHLITRRPTSLLFVAIYC